MTVFWVDKTNGSAANNGTSSITGLAGAGSGPKATVAQAMALATGTSHHEINIIEGTYSMPDNTTLVEDVTFRGVGYVILQPSSFGSSTSFLKYTEANLVAGTGTPFKWRFDGVNFFNWARIINVALTGSDALAGKHIEVYSENCVFARTTDWATPPSDVTVLYLTHDGVGGTLTPAVADFMRWFGNHNTVYGTNKAFSVVDSSGGTLAANSVKIAVYWERNSIYDLDTPLSSNMISISGTAAKVTRSPSTSDFNLVPDANHHLNGTPDQPGGNNEISRTTSGAVSYIRDTVSPMDFSLVRGSNTSAIGPDANFFGRGEYHDTLGATFWPTSTLNRDSLAPGYGTAIVMHSRSKLNPAGTDDFDVSEWAAGWANDENTWNTSGGAPGVAGAEGIAGSSPVLLTTTPDPEFVIDADYNTNVAAGKLARAVSPVYDSGRRVYYRSIDFFGTQNAATGATLDANLSSAAIEIEVRASNSSFTQQVLQTASGGAGPNWVLANQFIDDVAGTYNRNNGPFRYWQFRVTLRAP